MPILGDALEEAGCGNEDILKHCRSEKPHVRGDVGWWIWCWANADGLFLSIGRVQERAKFGLTDSWTSVAISPRWRASRCDYSSSGWLFVFPLGMWGFGAFVQRHRDRPSRRPLFSFSSQARQLSSVVPICPDQWGPGWAPPRSTRPGTRHGPGSGAGSARALLARWPRPNRRRLLPGAGRASRRWYFTFFTSKDQSFQAS